jgi:hypothetical protein
LTYEFAELRAGVEFPAFGPFEDHK